MSDFEFSRCKIWKNCVTLEIGVRDGDSVSRPVMEFIPEADQSKTQASSYGKKIF